MGNLEVGGPGTVGLQQAGPFHVFDRNGDVAAVVGQIAAVHQPAAKAAGVAFLGLTPLCVQFESLEVVPEDDVDDACYCVGSIDRRTPDRDRIDALHKRRRYRVDVHLQSRASGGAIGLWRG